MLKSLRYSLLIWIALLVPAFAGEISKIEIVKNTPEDLKIVIEGEYKSYRAIMLKSPFRFVIDIDGAVPRKGLPATLKVGGAIVSKLRTGRQDGSFRIVLDSARPDAAFHANIQDREGYLLLKCWREKDKAAALDNKGKTVQKPGEVKDGTKSAKAPAPETQNPFTPLPEKTLEEIVGPLDSGATAVKEKETDNISTYSNEKITLEFYKADLHNVFRVFSEISGKNIIVDENVKGQLTLSLKEVPWDFALELILSVQGLRKDERLNTLIISPRPKQEKGELIVRRVSHEVLQPARRLKTREEHRRQARDIILKAHNLEAEGKVKAALKQYEKAFALWENNLDLLKKTSYLHYVLGNFSRSYFFAKRALKLNTADAEAALYAALPAARMQKNGEARVLFETAVNGEPKLPEAFYNYGLFLEKHKDYSRSLSIYKKYEKIFGPSLKLGLRIAKLLEQSGDRKAACEKYRLIQLSGFDLNERTRRLLQRKGKVLCRNGIIKDGPQPATNIKE
jgi:type IV pilus assembly protein PilQ